MKTAFVTGCLLCIGLSSLGHAQAAALNKEQKKEFNSIKSVLSSIPDLARKKQFEEAEAAVNDARQRIEALAADAGLNENSRLIKSLVRTLNTRRVFLEKRMKAAGKKGKVAKPVSFTRDVAPILFSRCVDCHGENKAGFKLRLDTFAGMKQGGKSGPLLVRGKPRQSLIMGRLTVEDDRRMPKKGDALPKDELVTIYNWIEQGAPFDGEDENTPLGTLKQKSTQPDKPPVKIAMATGDETVSFKTDIAPFMVNLCLRCHNDKSKRGGFSIDTFEKLMTGGESGPVIVPRNLEQSRLWSLVGKQDPIKMPQGPARARRSDVEKLKTWISEGAAFDGGDPSAPLRKLVPTTSDKLMKRLASLTPKEFQKMRIERCRGHWSTGLPDEDKNVVTLETRDFFLLGNVSKPRLEQVAKWAEETAKQLRARFDDSSELLFKGRLAIFVFADRYSYHEFALVVEGQEIPKTVHGHSIMTAGFEDTYVSLEDIGDEATGKLAGLRVNLIDHITGAYLRRGGPLPEWMLRGTGLTVAADIVGKNEFLETQRALVPEYLQTLGEPGDLFNDGSFNPVGTAAVGHSLVEFIINKGGAKRFPRFIEALQAGQGQNDGLKTVYNVEAIEIIKAYWLSVFPGANVN